MYKIKCKQVKMLKRLNKFVLTGALLFSACTEDGNVMQTGTQYPFDFNVQLSTQNTGKDVPNQDQWLVFPTKEDYEKAVDYLVDLCDKKRNPEFFEQTLCFNSMRVDKSEEERSAIDVDDDVLAVLLNPNGMIQIENYILSIDMPQHKLYVENIIDSSDSFWMSTDNSFIDFLYGDVSKEDIQIQNIPSKSVRHDEYEYETTLYEYSEGKVKMSAKVSNSGIFHTMKAQISRSIIFIGTAPRIEVAVDKGSYYIYKSTGTRININPESISGKDRSYTIRPVYTTRDFYISNYSFNASFAYYPIYTISGENVYRSVSLPFYTNK